MAWAVKWCLFLTLQSIIIHSLGGLCLVGGAIGYLKKGSKISLAAGLGIGSLFLTSGYLIAKTDRVYEGHLVAAGTATLLTAAMGQRFMSTGKFMPAGLLAVLGIVALGYNGNKAMEWAPSGKSD